MSPLLRLLGPAVFLAAAAGLAGALLLAWYAAWKRDRILRRRALLAAGTLVLLHGVSIFAGPLFVRERVLPPGEELSFCGFDCHLHLTTTGMERHGDTLVVGVRLRSDARRAPEFPGRLRLGLVDADGDYHAALSRLSADALPAGSSRVARVRFVAAPADQPVKLVAAWGGTVDRLVPGSRNPLVQRRSAIALPGTRGAP